MEPRLEIASRLLSGIISQDQKRSLGARMYEVHHCLMLADALIANAASLPSLEISVSGSVLGEQPTTSELQKPTNPPLNMKTRVESRRARSRTNQDESRPTLH